jgi:predicted ribosomally synthesized peptide with SipW-like signal peptide
MKKKLMALSLAACLAALSIGGATLAYFTDRDSKNNQFTTGMMDITLNEVFDAETAELIPGRPIQKEVTITLNEGSVDSYVWYTYTIPTALDGEEPAIEIGFSNGADWTITHTGTVTDTNGILCNVYTAVYNQALSAGETTSVGMSQVTMSSKVDYDAETEVYTLDGEVLDFDFSNGMSIEVTAYGIQAATFASAQAAYSAYHA